MKRWTPPVLRICVFLLLGAIVNVAVAWGSTGILSTDTGGISSARLITTVEARTQLRAGYTHLGSSFGAHLYTFNSAAPGPTLVKVQAVEAGWPCFCFEGDAVFTVPHLGVPTAGFRTASHGAIAVGGTNVDLYPNRPRLLPIDPLWPGFAINTVFYAAVLWLLFAVPFAMRRRRRIRRGLCPACAYPVGTSDVCTECGKPVPLSLAAAARERE